MKKSNIIIIAMLIVALGGILSIFISQKHQDNIEYATKEIMLTDYNVIVVQAGSN